MKPIKKINYNGFIITRQTPKIWAVERPDGFKFPFTFPTKTDAVFYCERHQKSSPKPLDK